MPVISTNTAANSAVRYLNINAAEQSSSLSKLASGSRITQASDDAAGLAISTRISSDVATLNQAATNTSHAISVLQTADGGASNISDILERMKTLATESASGTVTDDERTYIDAEFQELVDQIDTIASGTRYNGASLLDGTSAFSESSGGTSIIVGSSADDTINVSIDSLTSTDLGLIAENNTKADDITATLQQLSLESGQSVTLSFSGDGGTAYSVTLDTTGSGSDGVWTADEIGAAIVSAATAATSTADAAYDSSTNVLTLSNTGTVTGSTSSLKVSMTTSGTFTDTPTLSDLGFETTSTTGTNAGDAYNVKTQDAATNVLDKLDAAIDTVSAARASIGAQESRFEFSSESIATSVENLEAANSAITDVDVASEEAKLASAQVKVQAAVAAASSANEMTQNLLKLLQ